MYPPYLKPNDEIRIISPSGSIQPEFIEGAIRTLSTMGFKCSEGNYARSEYGRFAGSDNDRIADLQDAINDPGCKAILCSRGGYGLARIIDKIDLSGFVKNPKWLIGFSDITALHNLLTNTGIASIHAIMAKHLCELSPDSEQSRSLFNILTGNHPQYSISNHPLNKKGKASGKLIGGNLSVLYGLRATPFDLPFDGNILFIEDIAEKPYHIDRMIQNLRLSKCFDKISGLLIGQFTDCPDDPSMMVSIEQNIRNCIEDLSIPVCFNFPSGHVDYNLSLILGEEVLLEVNDNNAVLTL